ncbi:MAG: class I SAM-dependent methyltransferase [Dehalococcoidia bacterium]
MPQTDPSIVAQGYDAVYEAMPRSPTLARLWKEHAAGQDYADDFAHISFVTLAGLRDLAATLRLTPSSHFADIACGMGGPALWLTRETGAHLVGIDFSSVAVAQAQARAERLRLTGNARFAVGSFADTGIETASQDAAMSIDALQYAPDKRAALREFARILRPGGVLAFFAFELDPVRTEGLPVIGDDPVSDYRPLLAEAGFDVLRYDQTPRWHDRLTGAYRACVEAQDALRQEMGPLAAAALLSEMTLTLERDIYCGRVLATAKLPNKLNEP